MILLYAIILYILLLKVLPFTLYPNYMLQGKVERYPAIVALAMELRGKDKRETLENVFAYLREHHASEKKIWNRNNLSTLLLIGDFSTEPYLNRDCFLWCHTQNRVLKSILVNSGMFTVNQVSIGRMYFLNRNLPTFGFSLFIHQYALADVGDTIMKADPFYDILEERQKKK